MILMACVIAHTSANTDHQAVAVSDNFTDFFVATEVVTHKSFSFLKVLRAGMC